MMMKSILGRIATVALAVSATFALTQTLSSVAQAAEPQREWTVLVYINGNNNLDSYGALDINEMEKVGSTDRVNVVVQWASEASRDTKRIFVKQDADATKVTSPVVQQMPQIDMGDYRNLTDFVKWGAQNYPAKHYMLSVWNHGSGWHSRALRASSGGIQPLNISFDEVSGNSISTPQLAMALHDAEVAIGQKIDIYGSDACLMAMVEVAQQMAGLTDYFVGSEETEPGDGWPYDAILAGMNSMQTITPMAVAQMMPKIYVASYANGSQGTSEATFSSFDMSKLPAMMSSIAAFKAEVLSSPNAETLATALATAQSNAQHYVYADYVDLGDFITKLATQTVQLVSMNSLTNLHSAISQFVIANVDSPAYKASSGVAIWLPTKFDYAGHSDEYKTLAFDQATGWSQVIEKMINAPAAPGGGSSGGGNTCNHWWCK
jgi:hypothetical protein